MDYWSWQKTILDICDKTFWKQIGNAVKYFR